MLRLREYIIVLHGQLKHLGRASIWYPRGLRGGTGNDSRMASIVVHDFVAERWMGRLQQLHQRSYMLPSPVVPVK